MPTGKSKSSRSGGTSRRSSSGGSAKSQNSRNSSSRSSKSSSKSSGTQRRQTGKGGQQQARKRQLGGSGETAQFEMRQEMMTPRIKNDLVGVVVVLVAVILMIAVVLPGDAVVTSWLSSALRSLLGVGAYILPVEMAVLGVCFFFLGRHEIVLPRVGIGLLMILVAVISLVGVSAPGAADDPQMLLDGDAVQGLGGWLGNGIAYGLLRLVGPIVSWVILLAVIVAGLILIGFSISGLIEMISNARERSRQERIELESEMEQERPETPVSPYARARIRQMGSDEAAYGDVRAEEGTQVREGGGSESSADFVPVTQMLGKNGRAVADQGPAGATRVLGRSGSSDAPETRMLDSEDQPKPATFANGIQFDPMPEIKTIEIPDFLKRDYPDDEETVTVAGRAAGADAAGTAGAAGVGAFADVGAAGAAGTGATAASVGTDGVDVAGVAHDVGEAAGSETSGENASAAAAAAVAGAAVAGAAVAAAVAADSRDGSSGSSSGAKRSSKGKSRKKAASAEGGSQDADSGDGESGESSYQLPSFDLLRKSSQTLRSGSSDSELAELAVKLQETLHEFNVDGDVVGWVHGPTVTLFKVSLASGVRVNKITALADDIGLAFASQSVRIFSPIAGTSLVGIEIPNDTRDSVLLGDVLPPAGDRPLLLGIGKDVEGNPITADLAKMPHLLIGGTTGSGKSVSINSMIMSVLMRATPDEVRMILIDPKRVELSLYNDIPHLFVPVVTDPHKAAATLGWAVTEMDRRLRLFEEVGARNLSQYNRLREAHNAEVARRARVREEARQKAIEEARRKREEEDLEAILEADGWQEDEEAEGAEDAGDSEELEAEAQEEEIEPEWEDPFEGDDFDDEEWESIPSIMIVIDELADLMMVAGKDVEASISRIAQLARAAGIHLIVATQRPSTNVITGLIKANITNRIAFNVASGVDSRVILDTTGAEHLVGLGDMLFSKPEYGKPVRVQGCFVGEDEINDVCNFWRSQSKPDYHEDIFTTQAVPVLDAGGGSHSGSGHDDEDLLWQAAEIVVGSNLGSTSALQRRLKVGYARAGRIMDMLEDKGIVGPANGSKPREVYVDDLVELENIRALSENDML